MSDHLTLKQHAQKVLRIQDACNLHGVVVSFGGWLDSFPIYFPSYSTTEKNQHPITVLYVDKLANLAGCQNLDSDVITKAYMDVHNLAEK